jgi:hypothetical protein
MNKFLGLFLFNGIAFLWLGICYIFPEYNWSIKIFLYIALPSSILGSIFYIRNIKKLPESIKIRYDSLIYNIIDYLFDIIFMIILIYLNYRFIFVLYTINILFTTTLRKEYKNLKQNLNEEE